jgi:hypothetical protein
MVQFVSPPPSYDLHELPAWVVTEAGDAPNVAGPVYIATFIPDQGQSALDLLSQTPSPTRTCAPPRMMSCTLSRPPSSADFAADVPSTDANFMGHSQPMLAKAAAAPVTAAAWHQKPPRPSALR